MATRSEGAQAVWAFEQHEHRDLVRGINRIHDVACEIGHRSTPEVSAHVLGVIGWLESRLEPHIAWEESWLCPEIDARTGMASATRNARVDHQRIREMAARLRADQHHLDSRPSGDDAAETRSHLFGLEALVRTHIANEERYLVTLLDGSPTSAPAEPHEAASD